MKFSIITKNLFNAFTNANKAVSQKATLPILSNVLIETDRGRLKISATDLEKSVTTWVGAKIEEEGAITVPARVLHEYLGTVKGERLLVHTEGSMLIVESENSLSKFSCVEALEFPKIAANTDVTNSFSINAKDLFENLSVVCFASATDDTRPILTGTQISLDKDRISFACVDGFRLAEKLLAQKQAQEKALSFVLPSKHLLETSRILSGSQKPVTIGFLEKENSLSFEGEDIFISIRQLDGDFPDYKKIVPQEHTVKAEIDFADLVSAIKLAGVFAKDESKIVKFELNQADGVLTVSSETPEIGESKATVKCKITGDDMTIAFNGKFLLDFLNAVSGKTATLESMGPVAPAKFSVDEIPDYYYVVMPVRVQS
ncbi:DNA polymerase III subunit beta [Candidatus Parcubacteria bacterium]|nr:DNA polymerase III subunit beta [Patescibacteria group bacterium]MBU4381247.1 DNA polymerase III subunit beta [Patescibacteria group bacterium]MCG2689279.1 DNA polymerase III subunit beta [Candidatus Parcubacteria bacterium]